MNTRISSATDAASQAPKPIRRYQSAYFPLPEAEKSHAAEIAATILTQLNQHETSLTSDSLTDEKKSSIATDLVRLTKTLPLSLALNILIEASQHSLFLNSPAHQIITGGINKEKNIYHSPLITGDHTLAFVKEYMNNHEQEVADFLVNPELLLMWINLATPLEVSKLFQNFYHSDSKYYVQLRNMAKDETETGQPGKALLCSALMGHGKPTAYGAASIRQAATAIFKNERSEPYERTFASLQFRLFPTIENIANATGCYLNANKVEFSAVQFTTPTMQGASFINASLDYSSLIKIDLTGAVFHSASLVGVNFSGSTLCGAQLNQANLSQCSLQDTDLTNANFTSANLSFANLQGANLKHANLEDVTLSDAELVTTGCFRQELLGAELTRLDNMIKDHPQKAKLRRAIALHILNYTRTPEVNDKTAAVLLKVAMDHDIFAQHDELHYVKTGINYAISTYQTLFTSFHSTLFSAPAPAATTTETLGRYETKEQHHLRLEYEKREATAAKRASARPPIPNSPPPPVPH